MAAQNVLRFSKGERRLAHFGAHTGVLSVHNLDEGGPRKPLYVKTEAVSAIDFDPSGHKLAVAMTECEEGRELLIYTIGAGFKTLVDVPVAVKYEQVSVSVDLVKYSPDGTMLIVYGTMKTVVDDMENVQGILLVLDTTKYEIIESIRVKTQLNALAWTVRGDCVLGASESGRLEIYKVSAGLTKIQSVFLSTSSLSSVEYSPDDDVILAGTRDGNVLLVDAKTLTCVKTLLGDINSPVSRVSIGKLAGVKVAVVTYAQGSTQPAFFVMLETCMNGNPVLAAVSSHTSKTQQDFTKVFEDYSQDKDLSELGTVIGEFNSKLVDSATARQNTLNLKGDGVHFQPNATKDLGMVSFINLDGKVTILSVLEILSNYWKVELGLVKPEHKVEKEDSPSEDTPKPRQSRFKSRYNRSEKKEREREYEYAPRPKRQHRR